MLLCGFESVWHTNQTCASAITLDFKGSIHPDSLSNVNLAHLPHALKFVGVLAVLYDHKPQPDHPRDPAGYCQTCNGTAVIVGSPASCTQNRSWLSFVAVENRYSDLRALSEAWELMSRSWCWWCGIWFSIKDGWGRSVRQGGSSVFHLSSCLCVCIHLFRFSALCPVWSRVHSQASGRPKPGHSRPPGLYVFSELEMQVLCWSGLWLGCFPALLFKYSLLKFPSACIPHITKLCSRADLVNSDYQTASLHLVRGLFIHTVTLTE